MRRLLVTTLAALLASAAGATACPGDTDGSGRVDIPDLLQVLADWGACPGCASDIDGDGVVGVLDLLALLAGWGVCPACRTWELPWQELHEIEDPQGSDLAEVSGIEVSAANPGILWAHDDGGHPPDLYALRLSDGGLAQRYRLAGLDNCDWEDMAIGPGPVAGTDYLYVLDDRCHYLVRVAEPVVPAVPGPTIELLDYEVFQFESILEMSDGEVLVIDPDSGTPYFVAFNENVYRFPMPLDAESVVTLELVATLDPLVGESSFRGGDVAPANDRIVLRGYDNLYEFPRPTNGAFEDAFAQRPCLTDASGQGQAEALSFSVDGDSLYAVSEGHGSPIYRIDAAAPGRP